MPIIIHRIFLAGLALVTFAFCALMAQQRDVSSNVTVHRIGFLALRPLPQIAPSLSAFKDGMRELGYLEGKDYVLEVRLANDDPTRYPALVAELSRLKVELIVAGSTPAAIAIHETNPTMPIVVGRGPDLVGAKLAESAAHPGGVVTGIEELAAGMTDKRLRFLKQAVPAIVRVAVLSPAPTQGSHALQYNEAEQTAKAIGVTLRAYRVSATSDFEKVFDDIAKDRADAILAFNGVLPRPIQERIIQLAAKHRLPAIYPARDFVEIGGLMSYGQRGPEMFRFAATYVDKIFKGAKPADLPLTPWTKLYLSVNTKTAATLDIALPPSFLSQVNDTVK